MSNRASAVLSKRISPCLFQQICGMSHEGILEMPDATEIGVPL